MEFRISEQWRAVPAGRVSSVLFIRPLYDDRTPGTFDIGVLQIKSTEFSGREEFYFERSGSEKMHERFRLDFFLEILFRDIFRRCILSNTFVEKR